jgi:hypothetical protein
MLFFRGKAIMIRGFYFACTLFVLFGCSSLEDKIQDVHNGESKSQVIAFLGKPDGVVRLGEYEALRYSNRTANAGSSVGSDYNVILLEGMVVEYGYGDVRENDLRESNPTYNN